MKKKISLTLYIMFVSIMALILSALIYQKVVFFRIVIVGSSMSGTLEEGQIGAVTKSKYIGKIKRGDIVVFDKNEKLDEEYEVIKRVIGLPGDHVYLVDNKIYINDELYVEKYINEKNINQLTNFGDEMFYDVTLGEDEYYVMGDNRMVSYDSRYYGAINRDMITGKLRVIYAELINKETKEKKNISWKFF